MLGPITTAPGAAKSWSRAANVWRLARDRACFRNTFLGDVARHHQASRDPDPRIKLDAGTRGRGPAPLPRRETRPNGPLGIVLVRSRVAETRQHPVAQILGDVPIEAAHCSRDGPSERR